MFVNIRQSEIDEAIAGCGMLRAGRELQVAGYALRAEGSALRVKTLNQYRPHSMSRYILMTH